MKIFGLEFKFNGFDIWHKGNQGSGSGMDADKVDGYDLNQGIKTTDSPTFANITVNGRTSGTKTTGSVFTDGQNTNKSYINFTQASSSNDPGFIYHESSSYSSDTNKGVIHICPTDDNDNSGDYVAIHGTNDPETIRLYTGGNISTPGTVTAPSFAGNATTATKLQTARKINGISFDGSADITITANPNEHTHDDRYYTETEIDTKLNVKSDSTHKYHVFSNGQYYYDSYAQGNYLRMFIENALFDTTRFGAIANVEYNDGANWVTWSGGDVIVKPLLDGREDTGSNIDHTHRRFRFEVIKATGWCLTALVVLQGTWTGVAYPGAVVTIENWNGTAWVGKDTCTFTGANTAGDHGMHMKVSTNLHDGYSKSRITIEINDWTDNGGYTTIPLRRFMILSNYSGRTLQPWSWNYDKVVNFETTPTVGGVQVANTNQIPIKLSQLTNDIGAGGGIKITTSSTAPTTTSPGDFWYKQV